jgi:hypothetical protein
VLQLLEVREQEGQGVVDLVGDARREKADGGHLLCLDQLSLRLAEGIQRLGELGVLRRQAVIGLLQLQGALADLVLEHLVHAPLLFQQATVLAQQTGMGHRAPDRRGQGLEAVPLVHVVEGSVVNGAQEGARVAGRRQHDHRQLGIALVDGRQQLQAVDARHGDVRDHHIHRPAIQHRQAVLTAEGGGHAISPGFDQRPDGVEHELAVVDQQDVSGLGRTVRRGSSSGFFAQHGPEQTSGPIIICFLPYVK